MSKQNCYSVSMEVSYRGQFMGEKHFYIIVRSLWEEGIVTLKVNKIFLVPQIARRDVVTPSLGGKIMKLKSTKTTSPQKGTGKSFKNVGSIEILVSHRSLCHSFILFLSLSRLTPL